MSSKNDLGNVDQVRRTVKMNSKNDLGNVDQVMTEGTVLEIYEDKQKDVQPEGIFLLFQFGLLMLYQQMNSCCISIKILPLL